MKAPIDLFLRFPNLLVEVMRNLDIDVEIPEAVKVDFAPERCTQNKPTELTADAVPLLKEGDAVKVAVVFEVQRKHVHTKPPGGSGTSPQCGEASGADRPPHLLRK